MTFGPRRGLVGVACEPDGGVARARPVVLLFNIGLHHRVGLGRVNVDMARELARSGIASLRFDLSGLGDSALPDGAVDDSGRLVGDIRQAMDFMASRYGTHTFVPVGLCSGTDGAHAIATADDRVVGAVHVDGYAYTTTGHEVRRVLERLRWAIDPFRLRRFLRRRARRIRGRAADVLIETGSHEPIYDRTYPPRVQFRADLDHLLGRGVRLLFVYSADGWFFNHVSQFSRMVGWSSLPPGIRVERWPDADHSFSTLAIRRRLVVEVARWVSLSFPGVPPPDVHRGGGR